MDNTGQEWIVYLDDTLRMLSSVSSSQSIDVGVSGTLPKIDVGYNEEFIIKNDSPDVIYFVRGCDGRITEIPVASTPLYDMDTLGVPNISISIRQHHVRYDQPKRNENKATLYGLKSTTLITNSVYIPEIGGFLCSLGHLNRVLKICKTRYQPIAPDSAMPVWIHAHQTTGHMSYLYATVNNRIVRVPVQKGSTEHAADRVIYYQWQYDPQKANSDVLDTIPTDHFLKKSLWETSHGEFVSTSYEELKQILIKRGTDMGYLDTLREQLSDSNKEVTMLRGLVTKLSDPKIQEDLLSDKHRERGIKKLHDVFDMLDRIGTVTKTGQDIHGKYTNHKRQAQSEKYERIERILALGSMTMKTLAPIIATVLNIVKFLK